MSSIARPPDPCLVAIILIVRSRAGPRFVFHYPPNPLSENGFRSASSSKAASSSSISSRRASRSKATSSSKRDPNESSSSEESGSSSDEDEEELIIPLQQQLNQSSSYVVGGGGNSGVNSRRPSSFGLGARAGIAGSPGAESQRAGSIGSGRGLLRSGGAGSIKQRGANSDVEDEISIGEKGEDEVGSGNGARPPWETLLGLPADVWEKLLSPSRSWHKRRFEVGINDLAFVGWPVFVREDGMWRKERRKKRKPRATWEGGELGHNEKPEDDDEDDARGEAAADLLAASTETLSPKQMTPAESQRASITSIHSTRAASESLDGDDKDSMTMFNVVFVLDPPLLEYSMRLREIYDNIIKKFSKALKWEQARTDYVWREARHISHIKEKAKEKGMSVNNLYSDLVHQSSLARAIYTVYTSISASKIASVTLSPDVSISLQIPPLTSTPFLAGPTDKAYPGLWLTTADSVTPVDDPTADENTAPHQVLAKHFALLLLDNEATILKDVEASGGALAPALAHYIRCSKPTKSFAQIAVTSGIPLSTIQMLASHLVYWRRARAIPPLHQRDTYVVSPNCDLSKLEVATAAYQAAFPTLPSLPKMLSAMSGTPRPYGSFIPSKDHKVTYFAILAWLLRGGWVTQLRAFARVKVSPEIKMAVEAAIRREEVDKYLSKSVVKSDAEDSDDDDDDDANSSSSSSLDSQDSGEETPMPGRHKPGKKLDLSYSLLDRTTSLRTSSLLLFPHRASPLESRWLDEIMSRFPERDGPGTGRDGINCDGPDADLDLVELHPSLKKYWPRFIKYFNGYDALEKIPVRENLKRKLVWQLLTRLGLVTGQQSSVELDPREQVLVSVRHW
ncbi:nitrogen permease regulator 3 family protein [Aspergillus aculeatinus CBS 121060]|uniref:Protein rmd11 n=1 Tax=Aspergillus aculeatinus CBS 121060 TaxID=1448322 RepID=A0ACD1GRY2_9EURO|nr:protein rmd11 [Aspergillus aculeatinus CBS 121060]RAH63959.1 protein rmd11 [Aspergillus aculeatinus CBS 121060]